jgi:hypothetical protein
MQLRCIAISLMHFGGFLSRACAVARWTAFAPFSAPRALAVKSGQKKSCIIRKYPISQLPFSIDLLGVE